MSDSDDEVAIDGTSPVTRRRPFVLLTGTPGVGKTATASLLAVRMYCTIMSTVGRIIPCVCISALPS